jgi:hypothetical protein
MRMLVVISSGAVAVQVRQTSSTSAERSHGHTSIPA